jgi:hypothetical protein
MAPAQRLIGLAILVASCSAPPSPGSATPLRREEIPTLCRQLTEGHSVFDEIFCADGAVVHSVSRGRCERFLTAASDAGMAQHTAIDCVRSPCPEARERCRVPTRQQR